MKRLIFIHGRSQEDKNAAALKTTWVDTLNEGLKNAEHELEIPEDQIHFLYYGDTLRDLCEGKKNIAQVIMKGSKEGEEQRAQLALIMADFIAKLGISDFEIDAELEAEFTDPIRERGPQNWRWVQAVIRVIDKRIPGAGSLIALATNDVHQYLSNDAIRLQIEDSVIELMREDDENIIVSHSLGTIVAYKLMQRLSKAGGWKIPLLVTLGSPLGLNSIRERLRPIAHPQCVGAWLNAFDKRDVVSLYPLDAANFPTTPQVKNYDKVDNNTPNRHGILGYLNDREVADTIFRAIKEP